MKIERMITKVEDIFENTGYKVEVKVIHTPTEALVPLNFHNFEFDPKFHELKVDFLNNRRVKSENTAQP